ncbi:MAG: hypothetical protein P3W93_000305, partial [Thermus sp.]|nr:hypothetical protein [Thermus sp.]
MAACLMLSTLLGSAFFAGLPEVAVGRLLVAGGHRALVMTQEGGYTLLDKEDSALYGLARIPGGFLAVGHLGKALLRIRLSPKGTPLWAEAGGQGILWGTDGRYAWGGYMGPKGWEALVIDLAQERALRLPFPGQGYAYGGLYRHGVLFLVGRVEGRGGFDGFLKAFGLAPKMAIPEVPKAFGTGGTEGVLWPPCGPWTPLSPTGTPTAPFSRERGSPLIWRNTGGNLWSTASRPS